MLPLGGWQRNDFFGAMLTASDIVEAAQQETATRQFLDIAVVASERRFGDCTLAEVEDKR